MLRFCFLVILSATTVLGFAIDPDAPPRGQPEVPSTPVVGQELSPPSPEGQKTDLRVTELQTADYYELVARARELALPETGGVEELRKRLAEAWGIELPEALAPAERTLTIDSAQEAGLIDVDAPGDGKLLRLSGGLHVTLVDNEKKVTHVIEAGELWYDQASEEMTARGGVVYTILRENSTEVFRGESLMFRLSDSQGVFYEGASDRSRAIGEQTLVFRYQGETIRRSGGDLVVLDTGTITSSLGTEPYYRIQAKKILVLAPGEWGLQDAWLYMGRVPVFYFPFFFQPGDEFFFNPVLSFPEAYDRRGTSLQTTTYILGRKKRDAAPLSFLQVEDSTAKGQNRVRRGLFMVRGTPPESPFPEAWTLRYLADFYSNLGFLTAVDGNLPGAWGAKNLTFSGGVGVTRTVSSAGLPFSLNPFQAALDPWAQSHWNGSWLGSWRIPVRWGGTLAFDSDWAGLSLEFYSDPLLYNDLFGSRSENFSVFSLLGLGPAKKTAVATAKTSLQWAGNVSPGPAVIAGSLLWDTKTSIPEGLSGDPENTFYLPSQLTLPQASLNLGGPLWPPEAPHPDDGTNKDSQELALVPPGEVSPATEKRPDEDTQHQTQGDTESELFPPGRLGRFPSDLDPTWDSQVSWSLKPTFKTDSRFDTAVVENASQSPWKVLLSRWSGAYDARLSWASGWSDETWLTTQVWSLQQQTQDAWYLGPSVTPAQSLVYESQDRQATTGLLDQTLTSTWKPWSHRGAWRESNLQYTLGTTFWEYRSETTTVFNAAKDTVTTHQAATQAIWYPWEGYPVVKLTGGWQILLPPLDPERTWSSAVDVMVPWGSVSTKISAKQTDQSWTWQPWDSVVEWKPLSEISLREAFQYDTANSRPNTSTTSLNVWGASVQYRHQRTTPYRFGVNPASSSVTRGWYGLSEQEFLPQELRFGYSIDTPSIQWWLYRNSLSTKINFGWPINLQKYSEMPLSLNYTVTYKLHRFVDFQISEGVINRGTFRYFPFLTKTFGDGVVGTVNPWSDLLDAFSVWDQQALRRSNFKMTNLSIALVHYLDDWVVKLDYSGSPQLNTSGSQYDWKGTLTLLVQWYPAPEIKTQINVDKEGVLSIARNAP